MDWTVNISDFAEKQLKKLDKTGQKRILDYLEDRLVACKNPRHFGEALRSNKTGLWRYRVSDYRVICHIEMENKEIVVLAIGHRRDIYR